MKKIFLLSIPISFVMICSCQKKDSAAEQQLAQRKTELDAREEELTERKNALDEREKALAEREKSLAKKERVMMNTRTRPTDVQGQISDPAQLEAEKQGMIQQLSTMIPDPSQGATGDPAKQKRPAARQLGPEDLQRQWQQNLDKAKMSGKAVFPAAEAASPTLTPAAEFTSPSPSSTPQ
jgi:septal ring factor EnvC (AmiA/AmiB activator)